MSIRRVTWRDARQVSWREAAAQLMAVFTAIATRASVYAGHPITFLIGVLCIVAWGLSGPLFHYSDTWQLIINTGTTLVTFLLGFLIQGAQNRSAEHDHAQADRVEQLEATLCAEVQQNAAAHTQQNAELRDAVASLHTLVAANLLHGRTTPRKGRTVAGTSDAPIEG